LTKGRIVAAHLPLFCDPLLSTSTCPPRKCPFPWGMWAPSNTRFLGPTCSHQIASRSVQQFSHSSRCVQHTDTHTHRDNATFLLISLMTVHCSSFELVIQALAICKTPSLKTKALIGFRPPAVSRRPFLGLYYSGWHLGRYRSFLTRPSVQVDANK